MQFINKLCLLLPDAVRKISAVCCPGLCNQLIQLSFINLPDFKADMKAFLHFKYTVIIGFRINLSCHFIHIIKLIAKSLFCRLLRSDFKGFKPADMKLCRGIFQFLHPLLIDCILSAVLYVFIYIPVKFL